MKNTLRFFIAGTALFSAGLLADIAVVVAPAVPIDSINLEQLERLYLHRPNRYPHGTELTPVDQKTGSAIRQQFVQKALWKTEIDVAEYWSRRMFSGKGRPPRQLEDDQAVIDAVISQPGAIGYIDAASVDERVKVLLRIPGN